MIKLVNLIPDCSSFGQKDEKDPNLGIPPSRQDKTSNFVRPSNGFIFSRRPHLELELIIFDKRQFANGGLFAALLNFILISRFYYNFNYLRVHPISIMGSSFMRFNQSSTVFWFVLANRKLPRIYFIKF